MKEKTKTIALLVIFIVILIVIVALVKYKSTTTIQDTTVNITNNNQQSITDKEIEVDESNFESEVLNSDKKVLMDVYATWCVPCKELAPIIKQVANENDDIKIVKLDGDKNKELAYKYEIKYFPTLIVIENGTEINRSIGLINKSQILELLGK